MMKKNWLLVIAVVLLFLAAALLTLGVLVTLEQPAIAMMTGCVFVLWSPTAGDYP